MANMYTIDASRWKELSGYGDGERNNWQGLLSPLDDALRSYIIHYGEKTGAAAYLFDSNERKCKCSKEDFFSKACLVKGRNNFEYTVTDFFYAGCSKAFSYVHPAWFGYVAVTTDKGKTALGRRDILVVWRGTIKTTEWFNNARILLTSASDIFGDNSSAQVHTGFLSLYTGTTSDSFSNKTSARDQVLNAVRKLVNQYRTEEVSITVTGFSLGAALATLNAMDIVANEYNKPTEGDSPPTFKVTAFVFAGPRVGGSALKQKFTSSGLRLLRITNFNDGVPKVPIDPYVHLGEELKINSGKSNFLKWRTFGRSDDADTSIPADEQEDYFDPTNVPPIPYFDPSPTSVPAERSGRGFFTKSVIEFFSAHNLDVYLHGVAGVQANDGFSLDRDNGVHDYALVNRYLNRLKSEYGIPANWWEGENRKKMEQQETGRWRVKT